MLLYYPKNGFCTTMYIQDTTQSATEQQVRTGGRLLVYNTTHLFNGRLCGTTRVSQYQKGKKMWILLKHETVSGSGISWAICKSAPCPDR